MPDPGTISPDIARIPKPETAKATPPPSEKPEATPVSPTRSPEQVRATLEALASGKSVEEAYKPKEPQNSGSAKTDGTKDSQQLNDTTTISNTPEMSASTRTPSEQFANEPIVEIDTPPSQTSTETISPSSPTTDESTTSVPDGKTETAKQPVESLPSKEVIDTILSEANSILLELRDMRLLVNAVATQAADTPLGNEVRLDALRSLEKISTIGLPPDQATQLNALQEKIKAMNLPTPKPEDSATLALLTKYNEEYPNNAIPQSVVEKVRTGDKTAAESVAQMLQTNNDLSALTWKELTGQEGFTKLTITPAIVLDLAGLPRTKENEMKAGELFGIPQSTKEPPMSLKDALSTGFMYGALGIMFFNQVALGEGGGGH